VTIDTGILEQESKIKHVNTQKSR